MEKLIIVDVAAITRDGLEGKRDGRKLRSPLGHGIVHGVEQQPCGVQVVEGVGLVASGFQFLLGLAAVLA